MNYKKSTEKLDQQIGRSGVASYENSLKAADSSFYFKAENNSDVDVDTTLNAKTVIEPELRMLKTS